VDFGPLFASTRFHESEALRLVDFHEIQIRVLLYYLNRRWRRGRFVNLRLGAAAGD
jgi:hypothetical protein